MPANEFKAPNGMIFVGLLTHQQKQAGYFVTQDEDFIYLFHRDDGNPRCITVFMQEYARVKEIRDACYQDMESG